MILDKIVADVKIDLAAKKKLVPLAEMKKSASLQPPPLDFALPCAVIKSGSSPK